MSRENRDKNFEVEVEVYLPVWIEKECNPIRVDDVGQFDYLNIAI